ncbi:pyroglutamyl-peptidase I [Chiayiivirga flava]|uniref:Pyrrolidone-carboxylate peptidase n=1 Tax=Chiayiivirga flava TaxID=659595 RepID=A0A7W8D4N3_9GAMM|nr:pyroglutamyl-peptidase I [Chiayiivirga flava]MBB5206700.1 pyroglutamyl-peptidase [Chiayiivirga flava]
MPRSAPCVLLTGFEPFGGDSINPAMDVVRELAGERIAGHRIEPATLPVTFDGAHAALVAAIERVSPALVVCVGQAGGRARISLERVALNLVDARIADNAGAQPIDVPVITGAPDAYFTTLPVKAMLQAMTAAGVPAELSLTAGTYVCNAAFFALRHTLQTRWPSVRGGFIHIPWLPEQAARVPDAPCLALETMSKGIGIGIEAALQHREDISAVGGTVC